MSAFSSSLPYASQRQPLYADNVVATSQPLAAQAGLAMLARGGNAIDAARGHRHRADGRRAHDQRDRRRPLRHRLGRHRRSRASTRRGARRRRGRRERFASLARMPTYGWDAVTVPGQVAGWRALSARFGALPFADLFAPAIRYARDGFPVAPTIAALWQRAAQVLPQDLGFAEHFLPRGRAPQAGERFACAPMAATLEAIAHSGGEAFYRGRARGGDGRARRGERRRAYARGLRRRHGRLGGAVAVRYRDVDVHEIPPNGQGIAALIALGLLQRHDMGSLDPDSVASQHLAIEAMKLAFADAYAHVADPAHDAGRPGRAARRRLPRRAREAHRSRARRRSHGRRASPGRHGLPRDGRCAGPHGVADPVQLHGLRLGRGRARDRHQPAEPRQRLLARPRASERGRPGASGRSTPSSPASSPVAAPRWPPSASWAARSSRRATCRRSRASSTTG